jgi:hypothetical protein
VAIEFNTGEFDSEAEKEEAPSTSAPQSREYTPEEQAEHLKQRDENVEKVAAESAQTHKENPPSVSPSTLHKQDKTHGVHGGPTDSDAAGRYQAWYDMRYTPEMLAQGDDQEGYKKFLEAKGVPGGGTKAPVYSVNPTLPIPSR